MSKVIDCVCFSLNDNSIIHREMAVRMVFSLRSKNKDIEVICLYSGSNKEFLQKLEIYNVIIIITKLTFEKHLINSRQLNNNEKEIAKGAYLIVDVPLHISNKKYALYVDCDIFFLDQFCIKKVPFPDSEYSLGACSERNWGESSLLNYFNTGFVVVDLLKMQNSYDNFISYIINKDFNFVAYDQGAINKFYSNQIMTLPDIFNYKPYWLRKISFNKARVLHFHGIKPTHMKKILKDKNFEFLKEHKILIDLIDSWGTKDEVLQDIKFLIELYETNG